MTKPTNVVGKVYGLLTVIERGEQPEGRRREVYWRCLCKCGEYATVGVGLLREGRVKSCGCLPRERILTGQRGRPVITGDTVTTVGRRISIAKRQREQIPITLPTVSILSGR